MNALAKQKCYTDGLDISIIAGQALCCETRRWSIALLLKIIVGILATIGAVVVLGIVVVMVLYLVVARRITTRVRQSLREFEALHGDSIDAEYRRVAGECPMIAVPPMRIHVVEAPLGVWGDDREVEAGAKWIEANGFELIGDFVIEELPESRLKVLLSDDRLLVAAIRQDDDWTSPYVEFCFDLGGNQRGGVSNPPHATIPLPEGAIGEHFDEDFIGNDDVLKRMLKRARKLAKENSAVKVDRRKIIEFFESAHAAEMDSRIHRGGLTEEEIRAALTREQITPTPSDIEEIQWSWQESIEQFLVDHSLKDVDESGEMFAVHDSTSASYLRQRICEFYESDSDLDQTQLTRIDNELQTLLKLFSPREAMARLRPLLPERLRFSLVDQLRKPVEADLYLLPFPE